MLLKLYVLTILFALVCTARTSKIYGSKFSNKFSNEKSEKGAREESKNDETKINDLEEWRILEKINNFLEKQPRESVNLDDVKTDKEIEPRPFQVKTDQKENELKNIDKENNLQNDKDIKRRLIDNDSERIEQLENIKNIEPRTLKNVNIKKTGLINHKEIQPRSYNEEIKKIENSEALNDEKVIDHRLLKNAKGKMVNFRSDKEIQPRPINSEIKTIKNSEELNDEKDIESRLLKSHNRIMAGYRNDKDNDKEIQPRPINSEIETIKNSEDLDDEKDIDTRLLESTKEEKTGSNKDKEIQPRPFNSEIDKIENSEALNDEKDIEHRLFKNAKGKMVKFRTDKEIQPRPINSEIETTRNSEDLNDEKDIEPRLLKSHNRIMAGYRNDKDNDKEIQPRPINSEIETEKNSEDLDDEKEIEPRLLKSTKEEKTGSNNNKEIQPRPLNSEIDKIENSEALNDDKIFEGIKLAKTLKLKKFNGYNKLNNNDKSKKYIKLDDSDKDSNNGNDKYDDIFFKIAEIEDEDTKNFNLKDRKNKKISEKQNVDPCGSSAPQVFQAAGSVKSPGYTSSLLPKSAKCSWKIVAPAGKVVKLTISEMSIEDSSLCQYDSVIVFDVINNSGVKMGRYCGKSTPHELLKSTNNIMFIYYVSDNADNAGKFAFSWTFENQQAPTPSLSICGIPKFKPKGTQKIVNGEVATPHSWPWQVSLRLVVGTKQYHICGGTIISKSIVLTAAHCVFDDNHRLRPISDFAITAGDHDQTTTSDGGTQSPPIKRLIVHEQYNPASASSPYDIAIFEVSGGYTFNDNIIPACLPTETVGNNDICYATGWGDTKDTGRQTILNQVLLPVVQFSTCSQRDYYGAIIKPTMVCAGYEQGLKDACQGDSGGPFVCSRNSRWYLQGVTSFGDGCALPRRPGIYTRVTSYLDWIKSKSGVVP